MRVDFAQLRPADARESLARRAAYDHINRVSHRSKFEFGSKVFRPGRDDIACRAVLRIAAVKVQAVRTRRVRVEFDGRAYRKPCGLKAEREPAASCKEVEHARLAAAAQPGDLLPDDFIVHGPVAFLAFGSFSGSWV